MDYSQKYLIELSRAAIFNETPPVPDENVDWEYIWKKSAEQNISGLIAGAVVRLPKEQLPADSDRWQSVIVQTMYVMSRKYTEFERMRRILLNKGLTPICLKGIVTRELYPIPSLRTMGDFDILFDRETRESAEQVFIDEGYTIRRDTLYSDVDKKGIHGELFMSLEDDFRKNPAKWDDELRKHVYVNDRGITLLAPTYELAYSIVHMAKHLTREGCGIRNITDAALIIKKEKNIDFDIVYEICKSQGYERVFEYVMCVASKWYGIDVQSTDLDADLFMDYLLCYGVFGHSTNGNELSKQVSRREGDNVGAIRRIFFPPKEMMWHKYQYLKKSSLLLPVAWVHRFITSVFIKKHSVKDMITGIGDSLSFGAEREKKLAELGLLDKK